MTMKPRYKITVDLIDAMYKIATAQPITGRGVAYKLFAAKLIASMSRQEMRRVFRIAREQNMIP